MKQTIPGILLIATLAFSPVVAAGNGHEGEHSHAHHSESAKLQLNAGQKWETDAALRNSMATIRNAAAEKLTAIHQNRLPDSEYRKLAATVEKAVSDIVAECQLPQAADEQLHIIVARLLSGSRQMLSEEETGKARAGAVEVINAVNDYTEYFSDPALKPLAH